MFVFLPPEKYIHSPPPPIPPASLSYHGIRFRAWVQDLTILIGCSGDKLPGLWYLKYSLFSARVLNVRTWEWKRQWFTTHKCNILVNCWGLTHSEKEDGKHPSPQEFWNIAWCMLSVLKIGLSPNHGNTFSMSLPFLYSLSSWFLPFHKEWPVFAAVFSSCFLPVGLVRPKGLFSFCTIWSLLVQGSK